ncbi:bifunctional folylpolyglutamate synthase/dihydrofolate synthase [candidate division KSB1 bacterium]|nr:bifunctional folylpolyglutamate synthase/dihydrofolate synthase [candidate division KSB1 bacterium]
MSKSTKTRNRLNFYEAVRDLNSRRRFGLKLGLQNMKRLLKYLDNPERSFRSIHIAGTNGKGSTAALLSSIFAADGFKTGLYTSPHITSVRERIKVNGCDISPGDFAKMYGKITPFFDEISCTYFECTTALAFLYFRECSVDMAIVEVGLGGKYDATNVLLPVCAAITSISLDHQEHLGSSLEKITREKCGIIKAGIPIVSNVKEKSNRQIIKTTAGKIKAPFVEADEMVKISNEKYSINNTKFSAEITIDRRFPAAGPVLLKENDSAGLSTIIAFSHLVLSLPGRFQIENAKTAIAIYATVKGVLSGQIRKSSGLATQNKGITKSAIQKGLKNVEWEGRFQVYREKPAFIIDVAHNEAGFEELKNNIRKLFPGKSVLLLIGLKEDANWKGTLEKILPICRMGIGIPIPGHSRSDLFGRGVKYSQFKEIFNQKNIPFKYFKTIRSGIQFAFKEAGQSYENYLVLCTGSHYTVNAVKKAIKMLD